MMNLSSLAELGMLGDRYVCYILVHCTLYTRPRIQHRYPKSVKRWRWDSPFAR